MTIPILVFGITLLVGVIVDLYARVEYMESQLSQFQQIKSKGLYDVER